MALYGYRNTELKLVAEAVTDKNIVDEIKAKQAADHDENGRPRSRPRKAKDSKSNIKYCTDAYKDEDDFDPTHPILVTCPNCEKRVMPDVEMKWDTKFDPESFPKPPCECCSKKCFKRIFCPFRKREGEFGSTVSDASEMVLQRIGLGASRIYIHICPNCKLRIMYGFHEEQSDVYD